MQVVRGDAVRRKEDLRLLTGHGCYSDDFNFPGQAYATALRAPHAHALIRGIDATAARGMPGVIAVLTGEDACADGLKAIPHLATPGAPPDIVLHNRDGSPPYRWRPITSVPPTPFVMSAQLSPSLSPRRLLRPRTLPNVSSFITTCYQS